MRRAAGVAASLLVLTGCSDPLEFADWTIPVPEGTRIIEYAAIPIEERTERIALVEDLVIGGDVDDDAYAFYRPSDIEVGGDGAIFVHDTGNHRIQAFDASGLYVHSIGREGEGPGEINRGGQLAIAGAHLVRSGDSRLSFWTLDGELVRDMPVGRSVARPFGLWDGSLIGSYTTFNEDRTSQLKIVRWSAEGEELFTLGDLRMAFGLLSLAAVSPFRACAEARHLSEPRAAMCTPQLAKNIKFWPSIPQDRLGGRFARHANGSHLAKRTRTPFSIQSGTSSRTLPRWRSNGPSSCTLSVD